MSVTEEELAITADRLEKKREQLVDLKAGRSEHERQVALELQAKALKAEEARLDAQIAEARAGSTVTAVRKAAPNVADAAAQMALDLADTKPKGGSK